MDNESWDLTPHHIDAARSAETSVGVPALTTIPEYVLKKPPTIYKPTDL